MAMAARTTAVVSFAICFIFGVGCCWRGAVANGGGSCGGCVDNGSSCGLAFKLSNRFFALAGARFFFCFRPASSCLANFHSGDFLKPGLAISPDSINGALRFANDTVDAFVRMDDQHVLALVEAVHGAHVDAVHGFAANAALVDDVGQLSVLSADRSSELIQCPSSRCSLFG